MAKPGVEEVFKKSGIPQYTFVKPTEYDKLVISLRTPGRGLIVEGPSGIGKTTSVTKALEELGLKNRATILSARKRDDRDLIAELPSMTDLGIVIIDDFHRLESATKSAISDYLKTLADEEDPRTKLVLVGINRAGDTLVKFGVDLNNRIDTIRFERNPEERVQELIRKGEQALNISINIRDAVVNDAQGSFHLAQLLCHETCIAAGVTERCETHRQIDVSFGIVRERVLEEQGRAFKEIVARFARGPKLRPHGRAPYLHLLHWLAQSNDWSVVLDDALAQNPTHRGSVGQVVRKGLLEKFMEQNEDFASVLHYDPDTRTLSVEDPKFIYYLRSIPWSNFARQVGYKRTDFQSKYDFALSFAGREREIAQSLCDALEAHELVVFYDKNEQHRILAENIEQYLAPIYRSEASYVIAIIGPDYPKRVWTRFESEQFRARFGTSVIPIWTSDVEPSAFDESAKIGGFRLTENRDLKDQIKEIADALARKIGELHGE